MPFIVSTRFYSFNWYQEAFINYYLNLGATQIRIYCRNEDFPEVAQCLDLPNVSGRIAIQKADMPPIGSYHAELQSSKYVYQDTLNSVSDALFKSQFVNVAFIDHDEFLRIDESFLNSPEPAISRAAFFEWYLPPNLQKIPIKCDQMLNLAREGMLNGKLLSLWGDPNYKDNFVKISQTNLHEFYATAPLGGFHRLVKGNNIIRPEGTSPIIVDHLKGIPLGPLVQMLQLRASFAKGIEDDWTARHLNSELEGILNSYSKMYQSLRGSAEMEKELENLISSSIGSESFFDNVIAYQNIHCPGYSRPSLLSSSTHKI